MLEPSPPLPANCDLRNFGDMPLSVNRLRDSEIASVNDAEVFRCAVLAWCAAWHQVPAASLPDDDTTIARMVGMGRDVKGWKKLRAAGALRGFEKATDGRLYHRVVAEKAAESWTSKLEFAWRREVDRLRKLNKEREKSNEAPLPLPPRPAKVVSGWSVDGADISTGSPPDDPPEGGGNSDGNGGNSGGTPTDLPPKGSEHKGLDIKEDAADTRASQSESEATAIAACYAAMREHWPDSGADALNWPGLSGSTGAVRMWLREGCELDRDILPVLNATCHRMKAKGQKPRSFNLFTEDVGAAMRRNTAPLPEGSNGSVSRLESRAEVAERDRREGIAAGIAELEQRRSAGGL